LRRPSIVVRAPSVRSPESFQRAERWLEIARILT
jgi:hypothetical protein